MSDLGEALLIEAEGDVLRDRHMREERIGLEHHIDRAPMRRHVGHIAAGDDNAAAVRRLKSGEQPQQARLAAARGTEQREKLAGAYRKRKVVNRADSAKTFRQAFDPNDRIGCLVCRRHRALFRRQAMFSVAARKVFAISMAIVIGPTPPGTGVIAPARESASA